MEIERVEISEEKEKLLYIHSVANRLCCSKKFVYELIAKKELKTIRLGSQLRVYENSINDFLAKNIVKPGRQFGKNEKADLSEQDYSDLLNEEIILSRAQKINFAEKTGIYFLIKENKIVYIGQTINFDARISQHIQKKRIVFNSVYYLPISDVEMKFVEEKYIKKFKPRYNIKI